MNTRTFVATALVAATAATMATAPARAAPEEAYSYILTPGWNAEAASLRDTSTARSSGANIATGTIRSASASSDLEARYRTFDESEPTNLHSDKWHGTIISIY